jgi:hypothetical protein
MVIKVFKINLIIPVDFIIPIFVFIYFRDKFRKKEFGTYKRTWRAIAVRESYNIEKYNKKEELNIILNKTIM